MIEKTTKWIWCTDETPSSPGYRTGYFRRTFNVSSNNAALTVHVSADSRYVLYLNGRRVGRGPAKGDIVHQFYDTFDLTQKLRVGKNVLAAQVVCFAPVWPTYHRGGAPVSLMTATSALMLQGTLIDPMKVTEERISTDSKWKACPDRAYGPAEVSMTDCYSGMGEHLEGELYPRGWTLPEYDDRDWSPAVELAEAVTRETVMDSLLPYRLLPRMIPILEETDNRFSSAVQVKGIDAPSIIDLIQNGRQVSIPADTNVSFILDAGTMTTAFPILKLTDGKGATINLTYSEAWYVDGKKVAHYRPIDGTIIGIHDQYRCRNGAQEYEPFHWRAFRYILVQIQTAGEPLTIDDLYYRFIGYPFNRQAEFSSSEPRHQKAFEISWRTVRLCSHETFEDCPYYEQNQYVGDLQVAMLFAGYVANDWKLARQGLLQFDWSRGCEGLTQSRYPTRVPQYLPTWSLLWVQAIRDYWRHTGDEELVRQCLDGVRSVLQWFSRRHNPQACSNRSRSGASSIGSKAGRWDVPPGPTTGFPR